MHIKWHLCDVNARPYAFASLGMRGNFDSIFLGISVARKLKTYRKSSNKPPPPLPIFRGRKLISPPPLPLNIIIIHDCQESIATVKIYIYLFTNLKLIFVFDPRLYILQVLVL